MPRRRDGPDVSGEVGDDGGEQRVAGQSDERRADRRRAPACAGDRRRIAVVGDQLVNQMGLWVPLNSGLRGCLSSRVTGRRIDLVCFAGRDRLMNEARAADQ